MVIIGIYKKKKKSHHYHINKTNICNTLDIQLLHIFEHSWLDTIEVWKFVLMNKLNTNKKYAKNAKYMMPMLLKLYNF